MFSKRVPEERSPNAWSRLLEARRAAGELLLDLSEANPTRVGLAGAGAAELAALADPGSARYDPDPRAAAPARAAVADYYRQRSLAVAAEEIVLTAGTSESYAHLFRLLADPGETLLVPAPSYPLFDPLAALEGVRLSPYRLAYDGRWHLDLGSLEAAWTPQVRGVIVVQPNHPTGTCLAADERGAERRCERAGAAIIADEVFGDFAWTAGAGALPSFAAASRALTFVLSGLSKVCGMPQLKLGWIAVAGPAAPRAEALEGLEWISDLFLSVGTPVQRALPQLLAGRAPWQARVRERIAANLARLDAAVARAPQLGRLAGEGGWAAILRVPGPRSEEEWALELLRRGVVVHPGQFYDMDGEAFLVPSLIVAPDVFDAGLTRIEALARES
jgi:aspartate/methionine/tyrosine aminotransferase